MDLMVCVRVVAEDSTKREIGAERRLRMNCGGVATAASQSDHDRSPVLRLRGGGQGNDGYPRAAPDAWSAGSLCLLRLVRVPRMNVASVISLVRRLRPNHGSTFAQA